MSCEICEISNLLMRSIRVFCLRAVSRQPYLRQTAGIAREGFSVVCSYLQCLKKVDSVVNI